MFFCGKPFGGGCAIQTLHCHHKWKSRGKHECFFFTTSSNVIVRAKKSFNGGETIIAKDKVELGMVGNTSDMQLRPQPSRLESFGWPGKGRDKKYG